MLGNVYMGEECIPRYGLIYPSALVCSMHGWPCVQAVQLAWPSAVWVSFYMFLSGDLITLPPDYLCFQSENRILLSKLINKYPLEIDATVLQKILRGHWKAYLLERPSLELCKSLLMLRDYNISGRLNLMEIPVLLHMLHFWRVCSLLIVLLIAVNWFLFTDHPNYCLLLLLL